SPQLGEPRTAQVRSLETQPIASAVGAESSWPELEARRTIEPEPRPSLSDSSLSVSSISASPLRTFDTRRVTNGNGKGGARPDIRPRSEPLRTASAVPPRQTMTPRPPARIGAPSASPVSPLTPPPAAPQQAALTPTPASFSAPPAAPAAQAGDE